MGTLETEALNVTSCLFTLEILYTWKISHTRQVCLHELHERESERVTMDDRLSWSIFIALTAHILVEVFIFRAWSFLFLLGGLRQCLDPQNTISKVVCNFFVRLLFVVWTLSCGWHVSYDWYSWLSLYNLITQILDSVRFLVEAGKLKLALYVLI